jgi:protein ImuB
MLLVAVDPAAEALGLRLGMPLADARAQFPGLRVDEHEPESDEAMVDAIADWCGRFTPLVALDPPDGLVLDITGCSHLFGGEEALASDLVARLQRQGFSARFGLADTAGLAWALARFGDAPIAPPGERGTALAPLPLAALRLDVETLQALGRVGLKRVEQILGQPRGPLARRYGMTMVERLDEALGQRDVPLNPRRELPPYIAERRLAEPLVHEEDVLGVARSLADRLCAHLEERGDGGRLFALELFRLDGAVKRLEVAAARGVRDPARIVRLFVERLAGLNEGLEADFGFDVVRLSALRMERIVPEEPTFEGAGTVDTDVGALGDRIGARLGDDAASRVRPLDTHIPERAGKTVPLAATSGTGPSWGGEEPAIYAGGLLRPVRVFVRPEPIETIAEVPDGPPARFLWRRVWRRVVRAEGPERIAPEWWRPGERRPTRDYYRLEDERGRRYWVSCETAEVGGRPEMRWLMRGTFA